MNGHWKLEKRFSRVITFWWQVDTRILLTLSMLMNIVREGFMRQGELLICFEFCFFDDHLCHSHVITTKILFA